MQPSLRSLAQCAANCAHQVAPGLTDVQALSMLLTTESLVFAVVGLTISFASSGNRPRAFVIPPGLIIACAVGLIALLATGAGFAWVKVFWQDFPRDVPAQAIAILLALAIASEPILALLVASGLRTRE